MTYWISLSTNDTATTIPEIVLPHNIPRTGTNGEEIKRGTYQEGSKTTEEKSQRPVLVSVQMRQGASEGVGQPPLQALRNEKPQRDLDIEGG